MLMKEPSTASSGYTDTRATNSESKGSNERAFRRDSFGKVVASVFQTNLGRDMNQHNTLRKAYEQSFPFFTLI